MSIFEWPLKTGVVLLNVVTLFKQRLYLLNYLHGLNLIILFYFLDDYAVPDVTKSAMMVTFCQTNGQTNNLDKPPPRYDALYAASDLLHTQVPNIPSLQVRFSQHFNN